MPLAKYWQVLVLKLKQIRQNFQKTKFTSSFCSFADEKTKLIQGIIGYGYIHECRVRRRTLG